ncbi:GNAT family N-acetyltransferase [Teratosphaeria destructans]|uniref:GNAT family N-acetyltransferase n=1 Tax=Teratosphaeria destructans TaxID=418781 RepID=A0A9W7SHZ2_9PEZI|nr:GNAT family N-acetyltransferase [Teratosphaeria destructans]
MTTIVRPRTEADFPGLERALTECHAATGWPLEGVPDARAFICEDQGPLEQAWVAEHNGHIVGHIAINAPEPDCPCVKLWRRQTATDPDDGKPDDRIAVVGRLFVSPTKKVPGVVRALYHAVLDWSRERDAQLIMYVVVWSAARMLAAEAMTARFGWAKFGDTVYVSPKDGRVIDAVCYAAPPRAEAGEKAEGPVRPKLLRRRMSFAERLVQAKSSFMVMWRNPKSESWACWWRGGGVLTLVSSLRPAYLSEVSYEAVSHSISC